VADSTTDPIKNTLADHDLPVSRYLIINAPLSSRYEDVGQPSFDEIRAGFGVEDIGGIGGYFTRGKQVPLPGKPSFTIEELGLSGNLGPFYGSAGIGETTFSPVPSEYRQYFEDPDVDIGLKKWGLGAKIPLPFLKSTLMGGVEGTEREIGLPQLKGQPERRTRNLPRTKNEYLKWIGELGPVDFGLEYRQGTGREHLGTQEPFKEIKGNIRIPF